MMLYCIVRAQRVNYFHSQFDVNCCSSSHHDKVIIDIPENQKTFLFS